MIRGMRSHDQCCAVAKALDVVGDRWTLLIAASCSYGPVATSELQGGLPGVATNLLADRLRHLEESGVVTRDEQGRHEIDGAGKDSPPRREVRWLDRSADNGEAKWRFLSEPLAGDSVGLKCSANPTRTDLTSKSRSEPGVRKR